MDDDVGTRVLHLRGDPTPPAVARVCVYWVDYNIVRRAELFLVCINVILCSTAQFNEGRGTVGMFTR